MATHSLSIQSRAALAQFLMFPSAASRARRLSRSSKIIRSGRISGFGPAYELLSAHLYCAGAVSCVIRRCLSFELQCWGYDMLNTKWIRGFVLVFAAYLGPASAQQASDQSPGDTNAPETQVGEVVVTAKRFAGGGLLVANSASQVVETISQAYISDQVPSANPSLLLSNLPSVNVSGTDAFGLAGGYNVQIHGLPAFDLGFVLDGVPVYNSGSAYSNETIDTHDLTTLSVAPGTSSNTKPRSKAGSP